MSHKFSMVSHKVMLSHNLTLSCQALWRSAQVVSPRICWVAAARRNLGTIIQFWDGLWVSEICHFWCKKREGATNFVAKIVHSSQPHSSTSLLRLTHTAFNNNVGFTDSVPLSGVLIWPGSHPRRLKMAIAPAFLHPPRNYINPLHRTKLLKNPPSLTP